MRKLWLHIGTPKTGSTAIQRFGRDRQGYLQGRDVDFLPRKRIGSYNDLGVYLRGRNVEKAQEVGAYISDAIVKSPARNIVISSEMFTGGDPAMLRDVLTLPEPMEITIVGYFRRQDKYLASSYTQKLKTGKIKPGFQNFLDKFGTAGGEYLRIVDRWQAAWPEAKFDFRRFDPKRFPNGDIVYDFMNLLGVDIEADGERPVQGAANPTPSIDVLDLMQLVKSVPGVDTRRVFRALPLDALPRFSGAAMDNDAAKALLAKFADDNDVLRRRFMPDEPVLFDASDLDGPEPEIAVSSFTQEQRSIISAMLNAVAQRASETK